MTIFHEAQKFYIGLVSRGNRIITLMLQALSIVIHADKGLGTKKQHPCNRFYSGNLTLPTCLNFHDESWLCPECVISVFVHFSLELTRMLLTMKATVPLADKCHKNTGKLLTSDCYHHCYYFFLCHSGLSTDEAKSIP